MGAKIALKILSISVTIVMIIAVIFGLFKVGQICYDFGYRVYTEPAMAKEEQGEDMLVQITSVTSLRDLAENLEDKGLIRDWKLFYLQAKISGFDVEPGIYTVNTSMTAFDMMKIMVPPEEDEDSVEAEIEAEEKEKTSQDGNLVKDWTNGQ